MAGPTTFAQPTVAFRRVRPGTRGTGNTQEPVSTSSHHVRQSGSVGNCISKPHRRAMVSRIFIGICQPALPIANRRSNLSPSPAASCPMVRPLPADRQSQCGPIWPTWISWSSPAKFSENTDVFQP